MRRDKGVTCKSCGASNLYWQDTKDGWRIYEDGGAHVCNSGTRCMHTRRDVLASGRKVVKISHSETDTSDTIIVLCDDNTMWYLEDMEGDWNRLPDIPQLGEEEYLKESEKDHGPFLEDDDEIYGRVYEPSDSEIPF